MAVSESVSETLVEVSGLSVAFGAISVLHGVDIRVGRGDTIGMVGESGSGKSVTWLAALGLLPAAARVAGRVSLDGKEILGATDRALARIRGGRIALIFQDPVSALNPVRRVGAQVIEALELHRDLVGSAARAEARRMFERVGIPDAGRRLDFYPHELSGGQSQRVMIAMALAGSPELLIADEPTTALDCTIQAQILDLLERLRRETGMAIVLISHDLSVVAESCDRVVIMYAGRIVEEGPTEEVLSTPRHPYTRGLIGAAPQLGGARQRLVSIPGQVPQPWNMPRGCAFSPRCPIVIEPCTVAPPAMRIVSPGHTAACIRAADDLSP